MQSQLNAKSIKCMVAVETMAVGGAEMDILRNFGQINNDPNFEIIIFIFGWPGPLCEKLIAAGVRVRVFNQKPTSQYATKFDKAKALLGQIKFFQDVLKTETPDIVHCFLPKAYLLGAVAKMTGGRAARNPSWMMSRLSLNYYMDKRKVAGWIERKICHRFLGFKAFIGNSKAIQKQLIQEGCPTDKVNLLYNGIDTQEFLTKRQKTRISSPIKITAVGNLHPYKGYDDLLEALNILDQSDNVTSDWICEAAGEDVEGNLGRLKAKAQELGLAEKVKFLGRIENVPQFLASADIFVHPSHTEGLPNAIIEAMASALSIVATNVGGIPELIDHEINGLLVESNAPEKMAHALKTYFDDYSQAYEYGQKASLKAQENFDLAQSVLRYKEIYREILSHA